MPSSTRWRVYISAANGATSPLIAELTMASSMGGSNLCSGGTPSASSEFSGAWLVANAFDGNAATAWVGAASFPAWIEYQFASAQSIVQYGIRALDPYQTYSPKDFKLQYWDGGSWVDADTQTNQQDWLGGEIRAYPTASKMLWRLNVTAVESATPFVVLAEVELRTGLGGADQATEGARCWAESTFSGTYPPSKAVDNDASGFWVSANAALPHYWRYWFADPKDIVEYVIAAANANGWEVYAPKTWTLEYYDGATWQIADTRTSVANWSSGESRTYYFGPTYPLTVAVGSFTLTGEAAGLRAVRVITAAQGSYALTGNAAAFVTYRITAAKGDLALTGNAAGIKAGRRVAAAHGSYTLTGNAAAFTASHGVLAGQASYRLTVYALPEPPEDRYSFTDQRHALAAQEPVNTVYTDSRYALEVYSAPYVYTDAAYNLQAYETSYSFTDAQHAVDAPIVRFGHQDGQWDLDAPTLWYIYADSLHALDAYTLSYGYTDASYVLDSRGSARYSFTDELSVLDAMELRYGFTDGLAPLNTYTLSYGYTEQQQDLDAYGVTHVFTDGAHALNVYDIAIGYTDAQHALQTLAPAYGFTDSTSALKAYTLSYGHTDALTALKVYEQGYGYTDQQARLNAYEPAHGFTDALSALNAHAPAVYGYTDSRSGLAAYSASYGFTDGLHALLAATELVRGWSDSRYALEVRSLAFGYADQAHALDTYSLSYGHQDGQYALNAWQALYGFLDSLHALEARALAYGYTDALSALLADAIFYAWVLNAATDAASRYEGFNFNSLCEIDQFRYLGASSAGIHELGGDSDAGTEIAAFVLSGLQDFGSDYQKRVPDAYIAAESDGALTLKVTADGVTDSYALTESGVLKNRKVPLGRGRKGRYWQFELDNQDGAGFTLDTVSVNAEVLSRRV